MVAIVASVIYLVFVFYSSANGILPSTCSGYGSLNCADVAFGNNALAGGAQLVVLASLTTPGAVNVSLFNAMVGGLRSVSGYCTTTGMPNGPTLALNGQSMLCVAYFNSNITPGQVYSGIFNISGGYCPHASNCPRSASYSFSGSWRTTGTSAPIIPSIPTTTSFTSSTTSISTSTSTSSTGTSTGSSSITSTSTSSASTTIVVFSGPGDAYYVVKGAGFKPCVVYFNVTNKQNISVSPGLQVPVTFNPSLYSVYERKDLGNIRFFENNTELYSWCESGCSNSSTFVSFWVKVANSIAPKRNVTIRMEFEANSTVIYGPIHSTTGPPFDIANSPSTGVSNVPLGTLLSANPPVAAFWISTPSGGSNTLYGPVYQSQSAYSVPNSPIFYSNVVKLAQYGFDGKYAGEAPNLSQSYGQYDNGGFVFNQSYFNGQASLSNFSFASGTWRQSIGYATYNGSIQGINLYAGWNPQIDTMEGFIYRATPLSGNVIVESNTKRHVNTTINLLPNLNYDANYSPYFENPMNPCQYFNCQPSGGVYPFNYMPQTANVQAFPSSVTAGSAGIGNQQFIWEIDDIGLYGGFAGTDCTLTIDHFYDPSVCGFAADGMLAPQTMAYINRSNGYFPFSLPELILSSELSSIYVEPGQHVGVIPCIFNNRYNYANYCPINNVDLNNWLSWLMDMPLFYSYWQYSVTDSRSFQYNYTIKGAQTMLAPGNFYPYAFPNYSTVAGSYFPYYDSLPFTFGLVGLGDSGLANVWSHQILMQADQPTSNNETTGMQRTWMYSYGDGYSAVHMDDQNGYANFYSNFSIPAHDGCNIIYGYRVASTGSGAGQPVASYQLGSSAGAGGVGNWSTGSVFTGLCYATGSTANLSVYNVTVNGAKLLKTLSTPILADEAINSSWSTVSALPQTFYPTFVVWASPLSSMTINWFRARGYPPYGMMPTVAIVRTQCSGGSPPPNVPICTTTTTTSTSTTSSVATSTAFPFPPLPTPTTTVSPGCQAGTLAGNWIAGPNYPQTSAAHSCSTYGNSIYCISGGTNTGLSSSAAWAPFTSGIINSWTTFTPPPKPSSPLGNSCVLSAGNIYCVGYGGSVNNAYYNLVTNTGSIGSTWTLTQAPPHQAGITAPSCITSNGYIYCIGSGTTYYAQLSSSGIGTWRTTASYPTGFTGASCNPYSGSIYCVGGQTKSVYYAPIANDGSLPSWIQATTYPLAGNFGCAISNGYIYCAGGPVPPGSLPNNGWNYVTAIYSAHIMPDGSVGNWIGPSYYPVPYFLPDSAEISCAASGGSLACLTGAIGPLSTTDPYADKIFSAPLCSG